MTALGDGIDPATDRNVQLCRLLGLDANTTTGIRIVVNPGERVTVEWTGKRYVTAEQFTRLLSVFEEPGTVEDGPSWKVPDDPWAPGEPTC